MVGQAVKYLVVATLLLAAAVTLVVGRREAAPVPKGVVRLQYWEKWTGEEGRQMRLIVDAFNETVGKEKGIFVEYTSMSSVDQKTLIATAAGVPPDVAGIWDNQLAQFASMDALEPLDAMAAEKGITPDHYKPIFWEACKHDGTLFGLVSTPASIVLHYNKALFEQRADKLRAAGLDPTRPPRTIDELDRYAEALTTYAADGRTIDSAGHLPMEPGWYVTHMPRWFGGHVLDPATGELSLTNDAVVACYEWIAGYAKKYGKDSISQFKSGLGGFATAQNPFITDSVVMMQQGPWMANYLEDLAPRMNRWRVPAEQLKREAAFDQLRVGMSFDEVTNLLGSPTNHGDVRSWDAGIKTIKATFGPDRRLATMGMGYKPAAERRPLTQWGAAPFPSAVPGKTNVAFCPFDVLVIPRGSKHKKEAFEFVAYVNRQDVMERICAMHCKNSPLRNVSREFVDYHPNPYIGVFEDGADSPDAFALPPLPVWPEVSEEMNVAAQKCYQLEKPPREALAEAEKRSREKWDYFRRIQAERRKGRPS